MEQTYHIDGICPVCGDGMVISRLSCRNCGSALEGSFSLSLRERPAGSEGSTQRSRDRSSGSGSEARFGRLVRLDRTQLEFVEAFLQCRGIIKHVEDMLGISYPTVKARLANVLETMGFGVDGELPAAEGRRMRREILAELAAGRISTDEALEILARDSSADEIKSSG